MKYSQKDAKRFFDGKLSQNEAKEFLKWMDSKKGEAELGSIIEEVWEDEVGGKRQTPIKPIQQQPKKDRGFKDPDPISPKIHPKKPKTIRIWFAVAASLTMLITFGLSFTLNKIPAEDQVFAAELEIVKLTKSTQRAQRKLLVLPDGSKVTLNAESTIIYGEDFKTNRTIKLDGEAFFEVAKDPEHPFTVISQNISTTALGTSFNVKSYPTDRKIQVSLATGKVRVEDRLNQSNVEILPGEGVRYDHKANSLEKVNVDLRGMLSWREGILHFDKVPFNVILEDLERWYGVEFTVSGKSKTPTLLCSGTFGPNEYLSNVLKALSYSVDFGYQIDDKTVSLDFNPSKPMKHPINEP